MSQGDDLEDVNIVKLPVDHTTTEGNRINIALQQDREYILLLLCKGDLCLIFSIEGEECSH